MQTYQASEAVTKHRCAEEEEQEGDTGMKIKKKKMTERISQYQSTAQQP